MIQFVIIIEMWKWVVNTCKLNSPTDGGVNVPTLVAVDVLVGLSERSGLLPFICLIPLVLSWLAERCSCANFCSFF